MNSLKKYIILEEPVNKKGVKPLVMVHKKWIISLGKKFFYFLSRIRIDSVIMDYIRDDKSPIRGIQNNNNEDIKKKRRPWDKLPFVLIRGSADDSRKAQRILKSFEQTDSSIETEITSSSDESDNKNDIVHHNTALPTPPQKSPNKSPVKRSPRIATKLNNCNSSPILPISDNISTSTPAISMLHSADQNSSSSVLTSSRINLSEAFSSINQIDYVDDNYGPVYHNMDCVPLDPNENNYSYSNVFNNLTQNIGSSPKNDHLNIFENIYRIPVLVEYVKQLEHSIKLMKEDILNAIKGYNSALESRISSVTTSSSIMGYDEYFSFPISTEEKYVQFDQKLINDPDFLESYKRFVLYYHNQYADEAPSKCLKSLFNRIFGVHGKLPSFVNLNGYAGKKDFKSSICYRVVLDLLESKYGENMRGIRESLLLLTGRWLKSKNDYNKRKEREKLQKEIKDTLKNSN